MTRQRKLCIFLFLIFTAAPFFAENFSNNKYGFSLDIPEGYEINDYTDDGLMWHFLHPNIPVNLIIKINTDSLVDSNSVLSENLKKLNAKSEVDSFFWNGDEVSISTFIMTLDQQYAGWAVSAPTLKNSYITLICYAPADKENACEQFIISTLNSLCVNQAFYNTPGIITTYAFPPEGVKNIELNIGGNKIKTSIDACDEEAAQFVVDLEYSVLTLYANHEKWKEAWQRYYRMIYRDSFGRLDNVSSDIFETLYPIAKKQNPQNSMITYAQMLLSWVQSFDYKRADDPKKADFTCLPSVLTGTGNDCDSRSLLICTLLKSVGTECLLLVSPEFSHAMAAARIDALGQQFELEGTDLQFIMGETTAKVTWGTIAQEHADRSKWFSVILP